MAGPPDDLTRGLVEQRSPALRVSQVGSPPSTVWARCGATVVPSLRAFKVRKRKGEMTRRRNSNSSHHCTASQNGPAGLQEKFNPPSQRKLFYSYSTHDDDEKTAKPVYLGFF